MKYLLMLIFFGLILVIYQTGMRLPYHFYREALENGIHSEYLELPALPGPYYHGGVYQLEKMIGVISENQNNWKKLHFNDFLVPFPVNHPALIVAPYIVKEGPGHLFGHQVYDYKKNILNEVLFKRPKRFTLDLQKNKVFQMPIFEKQIISHGVDKIWKELFLKNYSFSPYLHPPTWGKEWNLLKIPLTEMVYDLFILSSRQKYFPENLVEVAYWESRAIGVVDLGKVALKKDGGLNYRYEVIYYLIDDQIFEIHIKSLEGDYTAESYRQKFFNEIEFKQSDEDSSIGIYADFQLLDYQDKLTPTGMLYLYSAFSHQKKSEQFLKESIQFLERGKNDNIMLDPLYRYGWSVFGSSFSTLTDKRKETAQKKLERRIQEDLRKERNRIKNEEFVDQGENYSTPGEKIDVYLKRAKDKKQNAESGKKRGLRSIILN